MEIVKYVFDLTKQFPEIEKYTLRSQMVRAAVSIPSNIAEGTSRRSSKDFARYLEIALGSCFELETQLLISEFSRLAESYDFSVLTELIQDEQKMIHSFIRKVVPKGQHETSN